MLQGFFDFSVRAIQGPASSLDASLASILCDQGEQPHIASEFTRCPSQLQIIGTMLWFLPVVQISVHCTLAGFWGSKNSAWYIPSRPTKNSRHAFSIYVFIHVFTLSRKLPQQNCDHQKKANANAPGVRKKSQPPPIPIAKGTPTTSIVTRRQREGCVCMCVFLCVGIGAWHVCFAVRALTPSPPQQ